VDDKDYPALYIEVSACAESNQKKHFRLLKATIVLLIVVALLGDIQWRQFTYYAYIPPIAIAVSLLILFFFTVMSENKALEKNWFSSRSIAESIKSESWLYMMRANPYNKENEVAKNRFIKSLKQIIETGDLPWPELIQNSEGTQLTEMMNAQRNTVLTERKQFYLRHRLTEQYEWYSKKVKTNIAKEKNLMNLMWLLLGVGVVLAFLNAYSGISSIDLPINAVGVATTSSAAVLSWIGARKYKELSQSYSRVAHGLSFIEIDVKDTNSEDSFRRAVLKAEYLMDQEHRYWRIKRLHKFKP
jgi:hypothetical protein